MFSIVGRRCSSIALTHCSDNSYHAIMEYLVEGGINLIHYGGGCPYVVHCFNTMLPGLH